jgi:hypothetical protein
VIRVYDHTGNVIETHERNGEFRESRIFRWATYKQTFQAMWENGNGDVSYDHAA